MEEFEQLTIQFHNKNLVNQAITNMVVHQALCMAGITNWIIMAPKDRLNNYGHGSGSIWTFKNEYRNKLSTVLDEHDISILEDIAHSSNASNYGQGSDS